MCFICFKEVKNRNKISIYWTFWVTTVTLDPNSHPYLQVLLCYYLHVCVVNLSYFLYLCNKLMNLSYLMEKGLLWLRVPGYTPLWQELVK